MVRVNLKGVNKVTKRLADGSVVFYHYHRSTGLRLPGKPGDADFIAAYASAERQYTERHRGTFNQLSHLYSVSAEFEKLAESTRKEYRRMMAKAEAKFGAMPIAALEDPRVRQDFVKWQHAIAKESGAREADNRLSAISALLTWAAADAQGYLSKNNLRGYQRLHHADRSELIWLPEHVKAFMDVAPIEMQRALILALHTGQRQGDILRMTWGNYDGTAITIRQGKSGFQRRVEIPVTAALKRMLDGMDRRGAVILDTKTGRPWKARYFKREWQETATKAGITGLHFHDLRGTTVTLLAEAGSTVPQIAAITGHSLESAEKIVAKYMARTRHLATAAMFNFQNSAATEFANRLQTGPSKAAKGVAK